jgi:2-keto-4-pentenoate hydratase
VGSLALSGINIAEAAQRLDNARRTRTPIECLTAGVPDLTEGEAYAIAAAGAALVAQPVTGYKLGYTSEAMRRQMNVDRPNFGRLYAGTRISNASALDMTVLIHPLVEPEIALRIGDDLEVESVMPALELVDTRYDTYTFAAVDNIADNSSAARYVLGAERSLRALGDLRSIPATLFIDREPVATGKGSDALGDPLRALAWLINRLARDDITLAPGTIVLTGGLTRAYAVEHATSVKASFGALGDVAIVCSTIRSEPYVDC